MNHQTTLCLSDFFSSSEKHWFAGRLNQAVLTGRSATTKSHWYQTQKRPVLIRMKSCQNKILTRTLTLTLLPIYGSV